MTISAGVPSFSPIGRVADVLSALEEEFTEVTILVYGFDTEILIGMGIRRQVSPAPNWAEIGGFLSRNRGEYIFGYLGFELHSLAGPGIRKAGYPPASLVVPEAVVRVTEQGASALSGGGDLADRFVHLWETSLPTRVPPSSTAVAFDLEAPEHFESGVARVKTRLQAMQAARVTLARRVVLPDILDLRRTFGILPCLTPHSRCFYVRTKSVAFTGCSPELLADGDEDTLKMHKLSGTYRKGRTVEEDKDCLRHIQGARKLEVEHEISVGEALGKLSVLGKVTRRPREIIELSNLRHLSSTLEVNVPPAVALGCRLNACLPNGVSHGVEDFRLLEHLEHFGRGAYYGLIGVVTPDGAYSFSQVLRTVFRYQGETFVWVGAAVTADSDPREEYEETRLKLGNIPVALKEK